LFLRRALANRSGRGHPYGAAKGENPGTLDHTGEERTALRFWLDAEGKVVDVQQRQKPLMETFRNVRANGADLDPKTGVRMPRRE
jgi:hypothetical protein